MKQLQLIQILRINAGSAAAVADVAANLRGVNRRWQAQDAAKAVSGNADSAGKGREKLISRRLSLYAALTLLSFTGIFVRKAPSGEADDGVHASAIEGVSVEAGAAGRVA